MPATSDEVKRRKRARNIAREKIRLLNDNTFRIKKRKTQSRSKKKRSYNDEKYRVQQNQIWNQQKQKRINGNQIYEAHYRKSVALSVKNYEENTDIQKRKLEAKKKNYSENNDHRVQICNKINKKKKREFK